jgi:hypothetical protein
MEPKAEVIQTSMSALATYERCPRQYMYSEVRGWLSRTASRAMLIGTVFHAGLEAGYKAVQAYDAKHPKLTPKLVPGRAMAFREAGMQGLTNATLDRDGKKIDLSTEDRNLVGDMFLYAYDQYLSIDLENIEKVIAAEESIYVQVGRWVVRCTLDLVAKYRDQDDAIVKDHKTGDPTETKDFIGLDWQTGLYYIAARGRYGRPMYFEHVIHDRSVPPGFGHNPLTTATGQKRNKETLERMQDPKKFIAHVQTPLSDAQIDAYTGELQDIIAEVEHSYAVNRWIRRRIKTGPFSCKSCPYFEPCKAERDGKEVGEGAAAMMYIIKGSEEWQELQAGKLALEVK